MLSVFQLNSPVLHLHLDHYIKIKTKGPVQSEQLFSNCQFLELPGGFRFVFLGYLTLVDLTQT